MTRKLVLILSSVVLLSCLLYTRYNLVGAKTNNGHPVHNLNTGLNYTSIQGAIDANETLDGHTILVDSGVYSEQVSVYKNLSLVGENRDATIIDAGGYRYAVFISSSSNMSGFTVRNGDYGVIVFEVSFDLQQSRIDGNRIENNSHGGICLGNLGAGGSAHLNAISNNIIAGNTLFGICIWNSANNTLVNNTVVNNGHGIVFDQVSGGNVLRDNTMNDNEYGFGWATLQGLPSASYYGSGNLNNDIDSSNTVNGKPICYWVNQNNAQVPSNAGYVLLYNCTNITVDGCSLNRNIQGLAVISSNNTRIVNNNITDNAYGTSLTYTNNCTISGNTLTNNVYGIYLGPYSRHTTMRNNTIGGSQMSFGLSPTGPWWYSYEIIQSQMLNASLSLEESDLANDIDASNTINGKPIIYWINQHNRQVPENAGYVMLINSTDILVKGLNLSSNIQSIFIHETRDTMITDCSISNSIYGICISNHWTVHGSFNITLENNLLTDNGIGVILAGAQTCIVSHNTLFRNPLGILLRNTNISTISGNLIDASTLNTTDTHSEPDVEDFYHPEPKWDWSTELMQLEIGGIINGGGNNTIYGNTVKDSDFGIILYDYVGHTGGHGNIVFLNNFVNDRWQAYQPMPKLGSSHWDNGIEGNYWGNYSGVDANNDGIGDTHYVIDMPDVDIIDSYPLMAPYTEVNFTPSYSIGIVSNSSVSGFQFNGTAISFNASGNTGTLGFCRVYIPTGLLNDTYHVFVNGTEVQCNLLPCSNSSHSYLYFIYSHSTEEIIILPEYTPLIILSLFIITTLLTVTVYRRRIKA